MHCGLHHRRVGYIGVSRAAASECPIGSFQNQKKRIFNEGCCTRCGEAIFLCRSAPVGTCRTILTRRRFVSRLVLLDESMISYAWMAKKKGAVGNMTGTSVRVVF